MPHMSGSQKYVADQPARLLVRLPPLGGRVDLVQDAAQVDPDGGVAVAGLGGGDRAQLALVDHDQPGAVAADARTSPGARRVRSSWPWLMSKCSRVGRPEVSAGLANVSPSAPEIGQRSQTRPPPATGCSAEYLEAGTGNGRHPALQPLDLDRHRAVAVAAVVLGRVQAAAAAGRPSGVSANGEGVAEDSGTR